VRPSPQRSKQTNTKSFELHESSRQGSISQIPNRSVGSSLKVRDLDGVVSCAGDARFAPLDKLTDEDFLFSVNNKLMGQVNLIRAALPVIRDRGSITVTSGVLAKYPMIGSGAVSLVNAGLEGFARAAALEATRGVRVNVVSPGWVKETMVKFGMDPTPGKAAVDVAPAYVEAVEGSMNGETIEPK
jgi:NAD(P)-dependent dehydrogenase (short-subunit alcohol dehydrogenase family)